jgi:hypothetical protein
VATPPLYSPSSSSDGQIIPLPLSSMAAPQVHPSVVEYLRTFVPTPNPASATDPSSTPRFSDSSSYYMSSMSGAFSSDTDLFQQPQHLIHTRSSLSQTQPMDMESFPQYFPVYDYGPPGDNNNANEFTHDVAMAGPVVPPISGRSAQVLETNMHTTWNEFVTGLGMAN